MSGGSRDRAAIRVENLGKCFRRYASPRFRALEWLSLGALRRHEELWALRQALRLNQDDDDEQESVANPPPVRA